MHRPSDYERGFRDAMRIAMLAAGVKLIRVELRHMQELTRYEIAALHDGQGRWSEYRINERVHIEGEAVHATSAG